MEKEKSGIRRGAGSYIFRPLEKIGGIGGKAGLGESKNRGSGRMNVLFVTFYFPPEVGAPQRRIWEFAQKLKERGHRVKILTGFPNYPHGKLIAPYRRGLFLRENMDGLEVLRVFHFFGNRRGKWGRALAEGS